jgi:hypothetical protein
MVAAYTGTRAAKLRLGKGTWKHLQLEIEVEIEIGKVWVGGQLWRRRWWGRR